MRYRNIRTGLVFDAESPIKSPDIEAINNTGKPASKAGKAGKGGKNGRIQTTVRDNRGRGDAVAPDDPVGEDEG